jgi:hypothetical protein
MGGAPQGAMRVASQIWQVVFASQTLQVFCLTFRKKAQYVVVQAQCRWIFEQIQSKISGQRLCPNLWHRLKETHSPVAKMTTIRTIIVMARAKGWSLHQMDVNTDFIHGDLLEEMYIDQPPSYVDQTHPNLVCRLKKSLYGLKQTPKVWSDKIGQYLVTSGFQTSNVDFSLYVKKTDHGIVVIVIYVDDLIITRDSDVDIFDLKKLLKQKFEMKDLGKLHYFLNIEVIQSPKGIWLLQRQYALNKLFEYGMMGCKPILIPLEQNVKLSPDEGNPVEDTTMYRRIVGSLIYMTITRPNLSYVVGMVNQFMQTP